MKNNKLKASLAALMLLALSTAFAEPIKLDDVKIGSTVTREGISLGWSDYLPVPEGEWEVVAVEHGTYKGYGPFEKSPYIRINLFNKNPDSGIQLVQIIHSYPTKIRMGSEIKCEGYFFNDRLGTLEGQNYQLCIRISKSFLVVKDFDNRSKDTQVLKLDKNNDNFLHKRLGSENPRMLIGNLRAGKRGNYFLNYLFGFNVPSPTLNLESAEFKAVQEWLSLNVKKAENHYNGEKITFSEFNFK